MTSVYILPGPLLPHESINNQIIGSFCNTTNGLTDTAVAVILGGVGAVEVKVPSVGAAELRTAPLYALAAAVEQRTSVGAAVAGARQPLIFSTGSGTDWNRTCQKTPDRRDPRVWISLPSILWVRRV